MLLRRLFLHGGRGIGLQLTGSPFMDFFCGFAVELYLHCSSSLFRFWVSCFLNGRVTDRHHSVVIAVTGF